MGLEEAEKDIKDQDYEKAMKDIEDQITDVEKDFESVKEKDASGDLADKQKKAQELLENVHNQIDFLKEQVQKMDEARNNR